MKTARNTAIIIGFVLAGVALYFIFRKSSLPPQAQTNADLTPVAEQSSLRGEARTVAETSEVGFTVDQVGPDLNNQLPVANNLRDGSAVYTHPQLGFSFQYPEGFKAVSIPAGDGNESIVVEPSGATDNQQSTTNNEQKGFQIYIAPFDQEGPLTAQFIRSELPAMPMRNIRTAKLASVPAVVFESQNEDIGPTFEIWFVYPESPVPHGNYLYQIMAYKEFAGELTKILQSWKFVP